MRISVGLATRTLQRLYSSPSRHSTSGSDGPDDVSSHHWFSLHTSTRSFDFGATPEGSGSGREANENETVVLWVLTLQQLLSPQLGPDAEPSACLALSNAQFQWQRFDHPGKEWPCLRCTYDNTTDSPFCQLCNEPRSLVTLNPCLAPLMTTIRAMGATLGLRPFDAPVEAHLLWFLVQAIETAPPATIWPIPKPKPTPEPEPEPDLNPNAGH